MKARIIITDENGTTFEGEAELSKATSGGGQAKATPKATRSTHSRRARELDFDLPLRAFVNSYAGGLGGPKKFVLLVAHMVKGQEGREVLLSDVESKWNSMTSLLGGKFNRFYSGKAKDKGWVDTRKSGLYVLRSSWKQAIS